MYALNIEEDAKDDLRAFARLDKTNVARLVFFLQELEGDAYYLERLLQEGFEDEHIHVDAISGLRRLNLWRLKVRGLDEFAGQPDDAEDSSRWLPYRIIYAPDHRQGRFHVLGVLRRDQQTYDEATPRWVKLRETLLRLGLDRGSHYH